MILYLVRHGEPDYTTDTLTETGKRQAVLCAQRLAAGGIDEIHSSPMGRAMETAQPLAGLLGLPVIPEEWARELQQEGRTGYPDGVSKTISSLPVEHLHRPEYRTMDSETALRSVPGLDAPALGERYRALTAGLDGMLSGLGYARTEDGFYRQEKPNDRHIALFCHCAMMRILLSHLLHLPYQLLASTMQSHFTGITILYFAEEGKNAPSPALVSYGDVGHLYADGGPLVHYFSRSPF